MWFLLLYNTCYIRNTEASHWQQTEEHVLVVCLAPLFFFFSYTPVIYRLAYRGLMVSLKYKLRIKKYSQKKHGRPFSVRRFSRLLLHRHLRCGVWIWSQDFPSVQKPRPCVLEVSKPFQREQRGNERPSSIKHSSAHKASDTHY